MWKFGLVLLSFVLVACAEVPYDKDGRIIVPPTPNFATVAQKGPLDSALDELIIQIDPGAEEVRSVALISLAAIVACELNNCQRNRGSGSHSGRNLSVAVRATISATAGQSRIESFQRTDLQIQELAQLAEAIAMIADRDSQALTTAGAAENADSWVALYQKRQQRLNAAQRAVINHREQISDFSERLSKSSAGRVQERRATELLRSANSKLAVVAASARTLDAAIADMRRVAGVSQ